MKLYHVTEYANVKEILSKGLLTSTNQYGAVYLTSDWRDLLDVDPEQRGEDLAILEVEVSEDKLIPDEEFDQDLDDLWVWYVKEDIPPQNIRLVDRVRCIPRGTGVVIESVR